MKKNNLFLLILCLFCNLANGLAQTKVKLNGRTVKLESSDIINVKKSSDAPQDDDAMKGIMRALMGAENRPEELDVKFEMNDEPVEDGLFIFGIKAKEAKALTIEIFDEEGFEMSVSNPINIIKGKNYKALDVETLEDGKYFFLLTDGKGKELVREITIAHKK